MAILFPDLTDEGVPVNEFAGSGEANLAIDVSRLADSGLGDEERKERGIELGICTELDLREDGTSSLLSMMPFNVCYTQARRDCSVKTQMALIDDVKRIILIIGDNGVYRYSNKPECRDVFVPGDDDCSDIR